MMAHPINAPTYVINGGGVDNRIQVIHKSNGGLSSARNVGIERCSGDLMAFLDSDDWIESDYFESMINQMARIGECDIFVLSGYIREMATGSEIRNGMEHVMQYSTNDEIELMIARTLSPQILHKYYPLICTAWNKLYSTQFVKRTQLKFDLRMCSWEDAWFNFCLFSQARKVGEGSYIGYHYRIIEDSISHGFDVNRPVKDKYYRETLYRSLSEHSSISELIRQAIYQAIITSVSEDLRLCYFNSHNNMSKAEVREHFDKLKKETCVYEAIHSRSNKGYDIKRLAVKYLLRLPWFLPVKFVYRVLYH